MRGLTKLFPITILLIAAFILRTWNLTLHDLSGDEAFTIVNWTAAPLPELINTIGTIDPQPPLALISTVAWLRLAGISEFGSRLFSVLSSLIFIAAVYTFAVRLFNQQIALIGTFCATFNSYQLWFSQDVRPYAPWMATAALSTLTFVTLLSKKAPAGKYFLAHTSTSLLALGMFYFQVFNIVAHNLIALLFLPKTRSNLIRWTISQLFLIASLLAFIMSTNLGTGVYKPTASRFDILDIFPPLLIGQTWPYPSPVFTVLLTLLPIAAFALAFRHKPKTLQLFILIVIPALSLATMTVITNQPYFRARYIASIIGSLSVLFAGAITSISHRYPSLGVTILGVILTGSLISINTYHFNPEFAKAPQWRQIMSLLSENLGPNDLVLQNYPDPAFTYYYHAHADTIALPLSANPPHQITQLTITEVADDHRYIWFLPTPNAAWDRDQVVASWLQANLPLLNEYWIRNTHILEYAPPTPISTDIQTHATVEYPNILRTDGWRISPSSHVTYPATSITFELFYHPLRPTTQPVTFFVHLLPINTASPIAQADHPPQNQPDLATTWNSATLLRDIFAISIPPTVTPGKYWLVFGLYNPTTNTRLIPVAHPQSLTDDSTLIAIISIEDNKKRDAP